MRKIANFVLKIKDKNVSIIEKETKKVCVHYIPPSELKHINHDLKYNHHKTYNREDTDTHYILKNNEGHTIVEVELEKRSDLLNFINSIILIVDNDGVIVEIL